MLLAFVAATTGSHANGEIVVAIRYLQAQGESQAHLFLYPEDGTLDRRFVRFSPNWAAPFPLSGEPAFLAMNYQRYVPIPGSKKTANCIYLERWDASLNKVRFTREGSAAVCHGASMHRPGGSPPPLRSAKRVAKATAAPFQSRAI